MNRWRIPNWLESEVTARDTDCVYCRTPFNRATRRTTATWEHIVNDARIITRENIALCCVSCNASKGAKLLSVWLRSEYCSKRDINIDTVAPVVKQAIVNLARLADASNAI